MRTYDRLCRFLSSYPDVSVNEHVKRVEITALERYMETGKKELPGGEKEEAEEDKEETE